MGKVRNNILEIQIGAGKEQWTRAVKDVGFFYYIYNNTGNCISLFDNIFISAGIA
jgi:hypothetical protein